MKKQSKKRKPQKQGPALHILVSPREHAETVDDANTRGVTISEHVRSVLGLWRARRSTAEVEAFK